MCRYRRQGPRSGSDGLADGGHAHGLAACDDSRRRRQRRRSCEPGLRVHPRGRRPCPGGLPPRRPEQALCHGQPVQREDGTGRIGGEPFKKYQDEKRPCHRTG